MKYDALVNAVTTYKREVFALPRSGGGIIVFHKGQCSCNQMIKRKILLNMCK